MTDLAARVQQRFEAIASTSMADLPICHPRLSVATVGLETGEEPHIADGILITPWCMNWLRLPLDAQAERSMAASGTRVARDVGCGRLEFLGAHDAQLGAYEASSLFSPMHRFADQTAALAVARAILARLRQPAAATPGDAASPSRRRFLLFGTDRQAT